MGIRGKHAHISTLTGTLPTPAGLSPAAAAHWARVVADAGQGHLLPADGPLVIEYARALALADQAHQALEADGTVVDGKASPWVTVLEKQVRSIVALAARLRLCPQSRFDRTVAGSKARSITGRTDADDARAVAELVALRRARP